LEQRVAKQRKRKKYRNMIAVFLRKQRNGKMQENINRGVWNAGSYNTGFPKYGVIKRMEHLFCYF
jgi:hypothetical protein